MKRVLCTPSMFTLLLIAIASANVIGSSLTLKTTVASDEIHSTPETLSPPVFVPLFDQQVHQTDITLDIYNGNTGSQTEIYRANLADGEYVLIHTEPSGPNEFKYVDRDLLPRRTYYYKARAITETDTSAFSEPFSAYAQSKFYTPYLSGNVQPDRSVQLAFQDRSYHDNYYTIFRVDEDGSNELIIEQQLTLSDSGQAKAYIDYPDPGGRYIYGIHAEVKDEGFPTYYWVSSDTVDIAGFESLPPPAFTNPNQSVCGRTVIFGVSNPTVGAFTEIYRSLTPEGPFDHYYTLSPGEGGYIDDNLNPRTFYYYTLRSEMDGEVSAYSDTLQLKSGSQFYNPVFVANHEDDGTIKITFEDRTYAEGSYDIYKTHKPDGTMTELFKELILPDSGSTVVLIDTAVTTGEYDYQVNATLVCEGHPVYFDVAGDTVYIFPEEELQIPTLAILGPPENFVCGNEIDLAFSNVDAESSVEIFRSRYPDSGFELIYTETNSNVGEYFDKNLVSLKTYYYKVRARRGDEVSDFSPVVSSQAGYAFYPPVITTTILPNQSIEIMVEDRSYLDYSYELYGWNQTDQLTTISSSFDLPDSGNRVTIIDPTLIPGKSYTYHINVYLNCDGRPYIGEFVSDTVMIPINAPMVYGFTLVDPATDQDVRDLTDNDQFGVSGRFNIRANTNNLTSSVEFYLNGKWHGENQEPYALFGDRFANYSKGRLKPGDYTLTATAYSDNNQKGVKGNTLTIHFTVIDDRADQQSREAAEPSVMIDVFPNPIVNDARIEVIAPPDSHANVTFINSTGNIVRQINGYADGLGLLSKDISVADLPKGIYYVIVKVDNKSFSKRLIVK
jgi:hypothetical protein